MNRKKILFVMYNMEIGGTRKSLLNLLRHLEKYDVKVDLLLFAPFGPFMTDIPEYVCIKKGNKAMQACFSFKSTLKDEKQYLLLAIRAFFKLIKKIFGENNVYKKILVKYAHKCIDDNEYIAIIGFQEGMCSFFTTYTNIPKKLCWIHNNAENLEKNVLGHEMDYAGLDNILFVAEKTMETFKKRFPTMSSKMAVIKNIIPKDEIIKKGNANERDCEDVFNVHDCINVISVGRVSKQKAFERIIEIVPTLQKRVNWIIVGDGPSLGELKADAIEKELQDRVHFIGGRSNPYPYIKKADVFVLTSLYESQPMVILEALSLGVPVISTEFDSAKELLSDVGYGIICPNNVAGIAEAINSLDTEKLERMKEETIKFAYDNDCIINQIFGLIYECI